MPSDIMTGAIGFVVLLVLLAIRVPVGTAMLAVGAGGIYVLHPRGEIAVFSTLAGESFSVSYLYSLTILPLFVLMGNLSGVSGMSRDLYDAAHAWFGHRKGGLASSTIVGCAGFSALSGSSLASAVTMGRVAIPEMKRFHYSDALSTGSVAAGGTLGILIPPSAGFVIYAILTEESIGRLFMAGVLPGLILMGLFIAAIMIQVSRNPDLAPEALSKEPLRERLNSLVRARWIIGIVAISIGGIYGGVFSAVEAAGIGAFLAAIATFLRGKFRWPDIKKAMGDTLSSTATTFYILMGAYVFTPFVALSGIPDALNEWVVGLGAGPYTVLFLCVIALVVLGTFMEGFAILVLTLPLLQPLLEGYGFDMIWFGVLMVIVLEMGLISPPVGINVFIVKGIAPDVPMNTIFRGIWPFWIAMAVMIILLVVFPQIALVLPNTMFGS
ncbi:TRAP transporter large permease [Celeribacter halophilus]|jgi:tripartite ATP-independent transporter DctM subunit|uniref:TRAP transporter large permease n=1 Tax=Celeribacter halophilus TaxID=576117 RepID=UPI0026E475CD|nr:TRAP transporter large permease [Celeribacter halophilus]MDO6725166.1 TRAP transporter large permease [Celeribacter halophilus]